MTGADQVEEHHARWFADRHQALLANLEIVIRGKTGVLELALCSLYAEGHLLIEDVPGVGKTSIAKAWLPRSGWPGIVSSSPRICCPPISRACPSGIRAAATSNSTPGRCSPTSSSATRSTGPPRRLSRPCSR